MGFKQRNVHWNNLSNKNKLWKKAKEKSMTPQPQNIFTQVLTKTQLHGFYCKIPNTVKVKDEWTGLDGVPAEYLIPRKDFKIANSDGGGGGVF